MVFNIRSSSFLDYSQADSTGSSEGACTPHNQGNLKIMHRDICMSNIPLGVDFEAVTGRFSLALIVHGDVYVPIRGTRGFVAPEFFQNIKCTLKVDAFSYERMLLELISGKKIAELYRLEYDVLEYDKGLNFEEWIGDAMNELGRVVDPNLQGNYVKEEAARLLRLALLCSLDDPSF
ncbi:hypothetical protein NL676_001639 [Syzygium grande]|nr:hypothetical protein NL676_001639 [Syzygium grande]